MEELRNLQQIYSLASGRFNQYEGKDFILPSLFKENVKEINTNSITYNTYSAVIETRGYQGNVLNIYLPNQWFYIASYFTDFYNELQKYKREALKVFSKERLKEIKEKNIKSLTLDEDSAISNLSLDDKSKGYLKRFVTDYSWWSGAKSIDRGDFYVSPILNSANLVNASQSFVADLCAFLANKPDLVKIIIEGEEGNEGVKQTKKIVSERALNNFILSVMCYLDEKEGLDPIAVYAQNVAKGTPIKVSKSDLFHLVGMFIETSLDDIRSRNTPQVRWFEKEFKLGERNVYLSTQWVATKNYQLTFSDFVNLIDYCYGGKYSCIVNSKKEYELYSVEKKSTLKAPLQQIYYGAPGTGKSDTIYETTKDLPEVNVFRTTFHPDSDYSTFVGAYKPTMKSSEKIYTPEELTVKLKEIKSSGTPYPCHKFSTKYWKSLKDLSAESIKKILAACGFTEAYSVEVSKCIAIGQEYMDKPEDGRITYTFCPQAFTNAYIRAWQTKEPVFLIIEEINRGNCAQIFGDLFQLLDRDEDGYSKYEIVADNDLANHIKEKLENADDRENLTTSIKEGRELKLPNNLHIWATMNTSDQSLFPIDSAFKRRWDWKYIKIKKGVDKKTKQPLNWNIKVGEESYDWWEFINKINDRIVAMTSTADKQLGYFFCLADKNGEISADTFVNKVAFYLWNDVFKDYAEDGSPLLKYKKNADDKEESDLTFPDFFDEEGKIDNNVVKQFIDNVFKEDKTDNKAE